MNEEMTTMESVRVHLTGSDLALTQPEPRRPRRGSALRTFVLTDNDPIQQILPQNTNRCEAWVQCVDETAAAFTLHESLGDAQSGGNAGVTVPARNTGPYPVATTDSIWATADDDDLPVTISVSAIIEE